MLQEIDYVDEVVAPKKKPPKKSERKRLERERELQQEKEAIEAEAAAKKAVLRERLRRRLGRISWVMSSAHFLLEIFCKTIIDGWDEDARKEAAKKKGKPKSSKKLVTNSARQRELRKTIRGYLAEVREAVADYVFSQPQEQLESWMGAFLKLEKSRESELSGIFGISREGLEVTTPAASINEAIVSYLFMADSEETVGFAVEYLTRAMLVSLFSALSYNFSVQGLGIPTEGRRDVIQVTVRVHARGNPDSIIWAKNFSAKLSAVLASEGHMTPYDS